jgi:hypothetical protein
MEPASPFVMRFLGPVTELGNRLVRPHDLEVMFPGTRVHVAPELAGPEGSPASPDPVRFGASDMVSFSPAGGCTPGTLFIRSRLGVQYAVRIGAATGRTRILRYETGGRAWIAG